MKDIGLGIIDRYTIIVVLITLALAQTLFGLQMPADFSNTTNLLWGLVLFTGYLYLLRSLYRFPVVVAKAWIIIKEHYLLEYFATLKDLGFLDTLRFLAIIIPIALVVLPISFLLILIDYAEPYFDELYPSEILKTLNEKYCLRNVLKFLDRLGIVLITIVATLPGLHRYVLIFGVIGACLMVVVYALKGNFTAILKDELNKTVKKEKVAKKTEKLVTDNKLDRLGVSIKISCCVSCGKLCSEDSDGNVPQFCSLVCRQKWYPTWEKDWCIGIGQEREIINTLRQSGYHHSDETRLAIKKLEEIAIQTVSPKASIWALLAIIHDSESEYQINIQNDLKKIVCKSLNNILEQRPHLVGELTVAIFDESISVATTALNLIEEYQSPHKINEHFLSLLLKHKSWAIRLQVIKMLGKTQGKQPLFEHLGKGENFEDSLIVEIFRSIGESAIPELKQSQKNPIAWIRKEATEALISLGVDTEESDLIEHQIHCPKCQEKIAVSFSKEKDKINVAKTNFVREIFRKSDIRVKCPSCHTKLGVKFEASQLYAEALAFQQVKQHARRDVNSNYDYLDFGNGSA